MQETLIIKSPLDGWVMALSETPDPVFAQGMAGDGISISPTGSVLCAPCDGIIITNSKTPHAVGIRTHGGEQLLLHIGIDSVHLPHDVFNVMVQDGENVSAGQQLIKFDLERLVATASSPITPILLTSQSATIVKRRIGCAVQAGDDLFELQLKEANSVVDDVGSERHRERVRVAFSQGLHARPAAQLASLLRPFKAKATLYFNSRSADAGSMLAVMSLGIKQNDEIQIETIGHDSKQALKALLTYFEFKENRAATPKLVAADKQMPADGVIHAIVASRGLAVGKAVHLKQQQLLITETGKGFEVECDALNKALADVSEYLESQLDGRDIQQHSILQAHTEMIRDPGLFNSAVRLLEAGKSAEFAWHHSTRDAASVLADSGDEYMIERAADLRDLDQQVRSVLAGVSPGAKRLLPQASIVLADELLPSHLMNLDPAHIAGICTSGGGPAAHAAIIAASLGIPFLVAAGPAIDEIASGAELILDAENGALHAMATPDAIQTFTVRLAERRQRESTDLKHACSPAQTTDGTSVVIFANMGGISEVETSLQRGAEGCGLFRTEFLFQDRQFAPSENEQYEIYNVIAERMAGRKLSIRTMDIGGDKPIPYLPLPREDNPALGLRGVRTSFWQDELFRTQLRAILRMGRPDQVRILLPMVNDLADLLKAREYINQCALEMGVEEIPQIGIMIETPSSAFMSDQLLPAVDFASIGSNDLSQYILAIDRGHPELAGKLDAMHPAVLRCIRQITESASRTGRKISLCGGLASDPCAVPLLLGLGVLELSVNPSMIPRIKALVRELSLPSCQVLADRALGLSDAVAVRAMVTEFLSQPESGEIP